MAESPLDLIRLIAPTTTGARLRQVVAGAEGFLYLVARLGVTGATSEAWQRTSRATSPGSVRPPHCRSRSDSGSRRRTRRAEVAGLADGVVVGSALVTALGEGGPAPRDGSSTALRAALDAKDQARCGMTYNARGALSIYTRLLAWGGAALLVAVLGSDRRWLEQPWVTLFMLVARSWRLRRGQIPLSKFSYLTQVGVVGAGRRGHRRARRPVVLALGVGIFTCDAFLLRKMLSGIVDQRRARSHRLRRRVRGLRLRLPAHGSERCRARVPPGGDDARRACTSSSPGRSSTSPCWSAASSSPRTAHDPPVRDPRVPAHPDRGGRDRGRRHHGAAARRLGRPCSPVLGVLGLLTKRILEEAIAAEELNKIALRERIITSNLTLADAFTQLEKLAHRVLDWGDFRIYRVREEESVLVYRGAPGLGGPGRSSLRQRRRCERWRSGPASRSWWWMPGGTSGSWRPAPTRSQHDGAAAPLRERDHRHLRAGSPQDPRPTARRKSPPLPPSPLSWPPRSTSPTCAVPWWRRSIGLGVQIRALAATAESLRGAASATATAAQQIRSGVAEQEQLVARGLEATESLSARRGEVADRRWRRGRRLRPGRERGGAATGTRFRTRSSGLVQLHSFVSVTAGQVGELYQIDEPADRLHRDDPGDRRPDQPHRPQRRDRGGPCRASRGRDSPSSPKRCDSWRPRAVKRRARPADWWRRSWARSPRFPRRWIGGRRRCAAWSTCRPTRRRRSTISSVATHDAGAHARRIADTAGRQEQAREPAAGPDGRNRPVSARTLERGQQRRSPCRRRRRAVTPTSSGPSANCPNVTEHLEAIARHFSHDL